MADSFVYDLPPASFVALTTADREISIVKTRGIATVEASERVADFIESGKLPRFHRFHHRADEYPHRVLLFVAESYVAQRDPTFSS